MENSRFKNYGLWVSIAALIPLILNGLGINILPANYEEITQAILSILVMAGIISNPTTNSKWFGDDKKEEPQLEEAEEKDKIEQ
ncbi:holin [Clostridium paraputrificum]|uniref:holin n=1 Tax=Clostridium paraputrificum TaxID=29363 RepID=UPI003D342209